MEAKINLITIWTENVEEMKKFYNGILGFEIINDLGEYVEFKSEGVRFAICEREVMYPYSERYKDKSIGQILELAFPCKDSKDVNRTYEELIKNGVTGVQPPTNMPWEQRTALFSDPDGNIHEIFCELK